MNQKQTKKQAQQKRKRRSITVRLLVLCVAGYLVFINLRDLAVLVDVKNEEKTANEKKQALVLSNEEKTALLAEDSYSKIIEKAARERYGYVFPGEEIYIDISGK